jgi:hypothetical protein
MVLGVRPDLVWVMQSLNPISIVISTGAERSVRTVLLSGVKTLGYVRLSPISQSAVLLR